MKSLSHMQQFTHMYIYVNLFIVYVYVTLWNLIHSYMTKSYIHPNLTIYCAKHVFIPISLITLAIFAYYAGIMFNALATLLCSKLC